MEKSLLSSEKMDWATPKSLYDYLNKEFKIIHDHNSILDIKKELNEYAKVD